MATMSKPRDEHDPYYDPSEPETGMLPSLSEAVIIAVAAIIALVALYEIHDSLDRIGQSVAASALTRGVPDSNVQSNDSYRIDPQRQGARASTGTENATH